MTEATATTESESTSTESESQQEKLLTQAEVAEIVKDRLKQQAKNQFGDYAELKAKAEGSKTLEDRLASLESELSVTKAEALRSRIAAKFGISTEKGPQGEPSDADLFLTGSDESTLTSQAERLSARVADRKKQGNIAPKEGATTTTGKPTGDLREFAKGLFGSAD